MFLRASGLVRGRPDPPQGRRGRPFLLYRAALSPDKSKAYFKEKVLFLNASSLVRGGPDSPQVRRERPPLLQRSAILRIRRIGCYSCGGQLSLYSSVLSADLRKEPMRGSRKPARRQ